MTIFGKTLAVAAGAVTLGLGALAATPASAQTFVRHPIHRASRLDRTAARLDARAARADAHGHYRYASRLTHHAARLDRRAGLLQHRYVRHHL